MKWIKLDQNTEALEIPNVGVVLAKKGYGMVPLLGVEIALDKEKQSHLQKAGPGTARTTDDNDPMGFHGF
jgi:hypothetical protein